PHHGTGGAHDRGPAGGDRPGGAATVNGDRILLRGLRGFGHPGALSDEAALGMVLVIALERPLDPGPAGTSDDLAETVDYGRLAGHVAELVAGRPRRLLEAVAEDVASLGLA